ncbi:hypothetical protein pb186bvf_001073 [Paramecium bursaria]
MENLEYIFNSDFEEAQKQFHKLSKTEHINHREIMKAILRSQSVVGLQILSDYTKQFQQINKQDLPFLILLLSSINADVIRFMLEVDNLLEKDQFVGAFIKCYEDAIGSNHQLKNDILGIISRKTLPNANLLLDNILKLAQGSQFYEQIQKQFSTQSNIQLIIDRPLIKIELLTPRIKDKFLPKMFKKIKKNQMTVAEEYKDIKHKQKLMTKKLQKEISKDALEGFKQIQKRDEYKQAKQKQAFKRGKSLLEEQQMELKKLKTMQLNVKKYKKKSNRKAGNKQ